MGPAEMMALFGRYDSTADGYINFTEFVNKLMEEDFVDVTTGQVGEKLLSMVEQSNLTEAEINIRSATLKNLRKKKIDFANLRDRAFAIYEKIDTDNSGFINFDEYVMLNVALGNDRPQEEMEVSFRTI